MKKPALLAGSFARKLFRESAHHALNAQEQAVEACARDPRNLLQMQDIGLGFRVVSQFELSFFEAGMVRYIVQAAIPN